MDKFKQDNALEPDHESLAGIAVRLLEILDVMDEQARRIADLEYALGKEITARKSLGGDVEVLRRIVGLLQANQAELGYFAPQPVRRAAWWQFWR